MVSVNAGLYPQELLQTYYHLYPFQSASHPDYTELQVGRAQRVHARGIKTIHVRHGPGDPARVHLLLVVLLTDLDLDDAQPAAALRLITNTSIRHVLGTPGANCPLWLPVRSSSQDTAAAGSSSNDADKNASCAPLPPDPRETTTTITTTTATTTPYQIIPCCQEWVQAADFDAPLSDEEKKVPAMVDRLLDEIRRKNVLLAAKDDEIATLRAQIQYQNAAAKQEQGLDPAVAATVAEQPAQAVFDLEVLMQQYWWVGAALLVFAWIVLFR